MRAGDQEWRSQSRAVRQVSSGTFDARGCAVMLRGAHMPGRPGHCPSTGTQYGKQHWWQQQGCCLQHKRNCLQLGKEPTRNPCKGTRRHKTRARNGKGRPQCNNSIISPPANNATPFHAVGYDSNPPVDTAGAISTSKMCTVWFHWGQARLS